MALYGRVNQHARSCRVDVMPSGEMVPRVGACDPDTTWLSLAGIKFATHSPHPAVSVAVASGWSSAGGEWGQVSEYVL